MQHVTHRELGDSPDLPGAVPCPPAAVPRHPFPPGVAVAHSAVVLCRETLRVAQVGRVQLIERLLLEGWTILCLRWSRLLAWPPRLLPTVLEPGADRIARGLVAIIPDQAAVLGRGEQLGLQPCALEVAPGDELPEVERGTVQRIVPHPLGRVRHRLEFLA